MTPQDAAVVPAVELADLEPAAVMLDRARIAVPDRQLLGSGTTLTASADLAAIVTVLAYALKAGSVDLAIEGGQLVGVACWLEHLGQRLPPPKRRPPAPRQPSDQQGEGVLAGVRVRLELFDGGFAVPYRCTHHHLVYLATRPGYGAQVVTQGLLDYRGRAADEHGHQLYVEVHDPVDRRRLGHCGYDDLGISRGYQRAPRSWAMRRDAIAAHDTAGGLTSTGGGR